MHELKFIDQSDLKLIISVLPRSRGLAVCEWPLKSTMSTNTYI
jgi:hypothetical protein